MASRRTQKVAEAIREVVSMAILTEVKDPRIQFVTVTYVEVSADLRNAKIHVSIMGSDTQQRLSLSGLNSAAGFLQSKVADRIDTRYTPRLEFVLDMGVKNSIEVARILREVLPESQPGPPVPVPGDAATGDLEDTGELETPEEPDTDPSEAADHSESEEDELDGDQASAEPASGAPPHESSSSG